MIRDKDIFGTDTSEIKGPISEEKKTLLARMTRMDTERPEDRGQMTEKKDGYYSLLQKSGTRFLKTGYRRGGVRGTAGSYFQIRVIRV